MENQINIGDQNTQQIGQNQVSQPVKISEKPKINYWMISTMIFALLFFGTLSFNIFNNSQKKQIDRSGAIPIQQPTNIPSATTSLLPSPEASKTDCNTSESNDYMTISKSTRDGFCRVSVPLKDYKTTGYSLDFPADWTVSLAGAEGMNLSFNEGETSDKKWKLFLQLTNTDLPLEQADKATYSFEMSGPEPLVSPEEVVVSKENETIGDKQVLTLVTTKGDNYLNRFFLTRKGKEYTTLYMFKVKTTKLEYQDINYVEFLSTIRDMIASMKFVD